MIAASKWRALGDWIDRLPWWQQILFLTPLFPPAFVATVVAAICLGPWVCRRTSAVAALILILVYVPLFRSGVFVVSWPGWPEIWSRLWEWYVALMCLGIISILQARCEQATARWMGKEKPVRRRKVASLWDREIDG